MAGTTWLAFLLLGAVWGLTAVVVQSMRSVDKASPRAELRVSEHALSRSRAFYWVWCAAFGATPILALFWYDPSQWRQSWALHVAILWAVLGIAPPLAARAAGRNVFMTFKEVLSFHSGISWRTLVGLWATCIVVLLAVASRP